MKEDKKKYNSDVTKDDLQALRAKKEHLRSDGDDDSLLKNRKDEVDFSGNELDVPGRTLPNKKTSKTLKDEENQLYSQGGDENESLEKRLK